MNESGEVTVAFLKRGSGLERVMVPLYEFVDGNEKVVAFTKEDERELLSKFEELKQAGVEGVVHVVNQLTPSGLMVAEAIPGSLIEQGFYL